MVVKHDKVIAKSKQGNSNATNTEALWQQTKRKT